jgi:D-glycero-D-manno-heptose 1,7-bisphosphate phosphatase
MKLIILDRDGTINHDSDDFIKSPEEWRPLPGALEAIARLNHAGWRVVVASNQSGLGRGLFDLATLNAVHTKMFKLLAAVGGKIDAVFYCPHTPQDQCACRKPQAGLFQQIEERFSVDMAGVHAVGDSLRDAQAAAAVGCPTHLVLTGKGARLQAQALAQAQAQTQTQTPGADQHGVEAALAALVQAQYSFGTRVHVDLAAFVQAVLADEANSKLVAA